MLLSLQKSPINEKSNQLNKEIHENQISTNINEITCTYVDKHNNEFEISGNWNQTNIDETEVHVNINIKCHRSSMNTMINHIFTYIQINIPVNVQLQ